MHCCFDFSDLLSRQTGGDMWPQSLSMFVHRLSVSKCINLSISASSASWRYAALTVISAIVRFRDKISSINVFEARSSTACPILSIFKAEPNNTFRRTHGSLRAIARRKRSIKTLRCASNLSSSCAARLWSAMRFYKTHVLIEFCAGVGSASGQITQAVAKAPARTSSPARSRSHADA